MEHSDELLQRDLELLKRQDQRKLKQIQNQKYRKMKLQLIQHKLEQALFYQYQVVLLKELLLEF
jgi:hypothetical protein